MLFAIREQRKPKATRQKLLYPLACSVLRELRIPPPSRLQFVAAPPLPDLPALSRSSKALCNAFGGQSLRSYRDPFAENPARRDRNRRLRRRATGSEDTHLGGQGAVQSNRLNVIARDKSHLSMPFPSNSRQQSIYLRLCPRLLGFDSHDLTLVQTRYGAQAGKTIRKQFEIRKFSRAEGWTESLHHIRISRSYIAESVATSFRLNTDRPATHLDIPHIAPPSVAASPR